MAKGNPDSIPEDEVVSILGELTEPEDIGAILTELFKQEVDLRGILHYLSGLETTICRTPVVKYGEKMVGVLIGENNTLLDPVNTLPRGIPSTCRPVLLVAVGSRVYEDVEKRILQAIAHVYAACPGTTKTVIFWAAKWNGVPWLKYRNYFKSTMVVLKVFGANPILLQ